MAESVKTEDLRDFAAVLMDLPGAHQEASEKLHDLVAAVRETKKGGTLTLKIKVAVGKLDDTTLELLPDVTASIPRNPLRGGVFFADKHGNPTKDDPSALWLGEDIRSAPTFRMDDVAADAASGEIKEAPAP